MAQYDGIGVTAIDYERPIRAAKDANASTRRRFGSGGSIVVSVSSDPPVRFVDTFTATAGQQLFATSQTYILGTADVFYNGARLTGDEFIATDGTTITVGAPLRAGDVVDVVAFKLG